MWYSGEANKDQGCAKAGLRGDTVLCMNDTYFLCVINIITELRDDKALSLQWPAAIQSAAGSAHHS